MSENIQNGAVDTSAVSPPDEQATILLKDITAALKKARTDVEKISNLRAKADEESGSITQTKSTMEAISTEVASQKTEINTVANELKAKKAKAEADAGQITTYLNQAKVDAGTTQELANKADTVKKSLSEHEQNLKEMGKEYQSLKTTVEGLLPGATSAGLASSFEARKKSFLPARIIWASAFTASIITFFSIAYFAPSGLINFSEVTSWGALGIYILKRIPIIVPLVWFAIHSGRHYWIASRLEEDYAYKEAISRAFEGYKRQLADIKPDKDGKAPLNKFCEDVMFTLSQPPGKIYEQKQKDVTPLEAVKGLKDGISAEK